MDLKQEESEVKGIQISYFDTIAPSSKIVLLASGYLFAAGDCANHQLYRFTGLDSGK